MALESERQHTAISKLATTRSPFLWFLTSLPTSSTTPIHSCPRILPFLSWHDFLVVEVQITATNRRAGDFAGHVFRLGDGRYWDLLDTYVSVSIPAECKHGLIFTAFRFVRGDRGPLPQLLLGKFGDEGIRGCGYSQAVVLLEGEVHKNGRQTVTLWTRRKREICRSCPALPSTSQ
jgi:hypothetical protein